MIDKRKKNGARRSERPKEELIPIRGLWLDYHNTSVLRRRDAVKRAAESAMGKKLPLTAQQVERLVERSRNKFDLLRLIEGVDQATDWSAINHDAFSQFGCSLEAAARMSQLVCDEKNYFVTKKRLKFVRWLMARFPSKNVKGRYVLTASNALFSVVSKYLEEHGLAGDGAQAISADLLKVYKPCLEFFQRLIEVTGVPPEETLFVCNSWRTDSRAAQLGVNVVIVLPATVILPIEEVLERIGETKGRLFVVRSLREAYNVIERHFVSVR